MCVLNLARSLGGVMERERALEAHASPSVRQKLEADADGASTARQTWFGVFGLRQAQFHRRKLRHRANT